MTEIDQTRIEELRKTVREWVVMLGDIDHGMDRFVQSVRQRDLDVERNQIHRERSALRDSGVPHDEWTMNWSKYVLAGIDSLIRDRDNKRGIFA